MTFYEFTKIKERFFKKYRGLVKATYNDSYIKCLGLNDHGDVMVDSSRMYSIYASCVYPKFKLNKNDKIQLYDGEIVYYVQELKNTFHISCKKEISTRFRKHISPSHIMFINDKPVYKISVIHSKLTQAATR
jgi:hypothetical protein